MSGVEFERNRSNGDELIPRVSYETMEEFLTEFLEPPPDYDHVPATYSEELEKIGTVNPIVVEYIKGVAGRSPEWLHPRYVFRAGVFVYRLLELELAQRGREMPIVQREIADSLKVDPNQEERYIRELADSVAPENIEVLLALDNLSNNVDISNIMEQVWLLVHASGLGVYALIKAQLEEDSKHRRTD
jgi:hypothetical protein